jgi:hypothetical protein
LYQSGSKDAQYVALAKQNWMKKSQNMLVWLTIFSQDAAAGKRYEKT